ncbi:MAG: FAD-dependent oxidoreductase [Treponema sp.]|jgi:2,4-dienoyl-CoA reductase-like NADH-dependent reductase (Old Yellow Enzyme family)/thioredoxin reductase|nr:FAD-dependent oxidoreductase [Treponema sp.]
MDKTCLWLFKQGKIGSLVLKNRAVMAPAMTGFPGLDGETGDRVVRYYGERARGGAGLIITEAGTIDENYSLGRHNQLYYTLRSASGLERLCETVHRYDARIFAQLWHGGNTCDPALIGKQTVSASDVPVIPGNVPRPLRKDEIKTLVERYAQAAALCKKAGYDGVEIHAAHGYLIAQFLSRYFNKRVDEYGGSFENRFRFLHEILTAVRQAVGAQFPVSVRFSADEMASAWSADHMNIDDGLQLAKKLDQSGMVDVLNVSNCNRLTPNANCEPYFYETGWKQHIARAIKEAVSLPVIATNTIKTPEQAERQLAEGVSDFVAMARAFFADPFFLWKTARRQEKEIWNCIGCLVCRESMGGGGTLCSVNPAIGYEESYASLRRNGENRPVVVVGGGPAGMRAAAVLAERGFKVSLYEQSGSLGGKLNLIDKMLHKEKIGALNRTLQVHLEKSGAEVYLNIKITPELIESLKPCGLFIALGAVPIIPKIEGIQLPHVIRAEDMICHNLLPKGRILIAGAGLTGLEAAEILLRNGREVIIADMIPELGAGIYEPILGEIRGILKNYSPEFYLGWQLATIDNTAVTLIKHNGSDTIKIAVDSVVLALGAVSDTVQIDALYGKVQNTLLIGDAQKAGRIYNAIKTGFCSAFAFDP